MAKFGDIGEFRTGGTPSSSHPEYYGTEYPWITTVALGSTYIDSSDATAFLSNEGLSNSSTKVIDAGSLLIGIRVGVGKCSINNVPMCTSQDIVSVVGIDKKKYYLPFLVAFVNSKKDYFDAQKRGATIKGITTALIKDLVIPDLSYEKQKEIASVLECLQLLIEQHNDMLALIDQLVKSRFIEMFGDPVSNPKGWPVQNFEDISILITDGEHATPRRSENGVYLLSARNVLNHTLQLEDVDFIDEDEYSRIARRVIPQEGDVLISCSGSIGRCCVVPANLRFQMVRSAALIRFTDAINPIFAEWLITSDELQRQIAKSATQSSQANLFQGKIQKLHGYVPPKALQNEFALFVIQTDKSKYSAEMEVAA